MTKNLYLILGRSGTGKSRVVDEVKALGDYTSVSSFTDRPPRFDGEENHIFLSPAEYDALATRVAEVTYNGYRYCTTAETLNVIDLYVIEPKGAMELLKTYTKRPIVIIGIYAPMWEIEARMRKRGDSEDAIKSRLENDEIAFGIMDDLCDAIFVNRKLNDTASDVFAFIAAREERVRMRERAKASAERRRA